MDSKALAELMEQRRAEERERRLAAAKADSSAAGEGNAGGGYAFASMDPAVDALTQGLESRLDMDPHTSKAENARLSLALASLGGVPPNISTDGLFNDKDSDDELDDDDDDDAVTVDGTPRAKKRSTSGIAARLSAVSGGVKSHDSDEEKDATKKKDKINALLARAKVFGKIFKFLGFKSNVYNNYFRKARLRNPRANPSTIPHCNQRLRIGTWYGS
jgi:hypothetical protein